MSGKSYPRLYRLQQGDIFEFKDNTGDLQGVWKVSYRNDDRQVMHIQQVDSIFIIEVTTDVRKLDIHHEEVYLRS